MIGLLVYIGVWDRFILGGQTDNFPEKVTEIMVLPEKKPRFCPKFPKILPKFEGVIPPPPLPPPPPRTAMFALRITSHPTGGARVCNFICHMDSCLTYIICYMVEMEVEHCLTTVSTPYLRTRYGVLTVVRQWEVE